MEQLSFVFSNKLSWRLLRHFSFWLLWFLFQLMLYSFSPSPLLRNQSLINRIIITFPETLIFMLPSLFLAYCLMNFVIPRLVLPGKYGWASICTLVIIILTAVLSALLSVFVVDYLRHMHADGISPIVAGEGSPGFNVQFGLAMLAGLRGSITVGGLAAAIKLMKCFYEKQQSALLLEKEKMNAELQILKAQLHPHFLFNTLNNIYSFTQDVSEKASAMILGLSQLLRYILYDCNKPLVPLAQELAMIKDYLALEATRYGEELEMTVQFPGTGNFLIAPLMILPFVENAFKHGASQVMERPWISLLVEVRDHELWMKLINGKPSVTSKTTPGIGIANVRKRLELLYPDRHELIVNDEDEMYIVNLKISLVAAGTDLAQFSYDGSDEKI